jgi:hypothetical protein
MVLPDTGDVQIDSVANDILSKLDDTAGADTGDTGTEQTNAAGDEPSKEDVTKVEQALEADKGEAKAKSKDAKDADTEAKDEAEQPAEDDKSDAQDATLIEPPVSWKAEEKERFKALPPETQKYLVDRENEREAVLTNANKEKATAVREAKAAAEASQRDRALYANNIDTIIAAARRLHPGLAEGDRLSQNNGEGWRLLEAQNPEAAKLKWAEYVALNTQLNGIAGEAQKARTAYDAEAQKRDMAAVQAANDALSKDPLMGPIWTDDTKRAAFQNDLKTFLTKQGFEEDLLHQIRDPRVFPIAKLAMERAAQTVPYEELSAKAAKYDKLMAEQAKIASQKVAKAGKTLKPQAADDGDDKGAMKQRIKGANGGRLEDLAGAIAAGL